MTLRITSSNFSANALVVAAGPHISNVQVTNSSYTVTGGNANVSTGGYITITGENFTSGGQVLISRTPATAISYISSSQLNVQVPAKTAGTYQVYVVNADGGICIRVNGISYS